RPGRHGRPGGGREGGRRRPVGRGRDAAARRDARRAPQGPHREGDAGQGSRHRRPAFRRAGRAQGEVDGVVAENPESGIQNPGCPAPSCPPRGDAGRMRWKVMTATVLAWAGLLAFLVYARILQHCAVVEPDNYETWPDFQILVGLMVWIP